MSVGGVGGSGPYSAASGAGGVDFSERVQFSDPHLEAIATVAADVLGDHVFGHEETLLRLGVDRPAGIDWPQALREVLEAHYIDEIAPTPVADPASGIDNAVRALDYLRTATPEAQARLDRLRDALRANLGAGLELYHLDAQGSGTFGEASGFAVLDPANAEVLIALSGYAE